MKNIRTQKWKLGLDRESEDLPLLFIQNNDFAKKKKKMVFVHQFSGAFSLVFPDFFLFWALQNLLSVVLEK